MIYHTKICIVDCTASIFILHHETNDILTTSSTIEIANSIISLASDTTENVNMVMVLGLTIRNDKWGVKRKKVNEKLKKQCNYSSILFISHNNIVRTMSNNNKLYLKSYDTKTLPNIFIQLLGSDMIDLQG